MKRTNSLLAISLAFVACACSSSEEKEQQTEVELPLVELDAAYSKDVPQTKTYTASVYADNTNNISPSIPNRITNITVDVGDKVTRGQTLVTLDHASIDQLKVNLDNIQREYDRAVQLKEIGAGTQQAVDMQRAQLDALKSQYKNLMENTVLVSPITGVVTARNYDPGDMTGNQPILTIGQISPRVKVLINITENDFTKVNEGTPVTVSFDAFPGENFEGKINRIYPTVDPNTRTFQSEIYIKNPDGRILPGMFARVGLDLGSQHNVVVPDRAVVKQTGSGNKYVYVYKDGKVSFNQVQLGQRLGDSYELLSGVEEGDSVVVAGQSRLAHGVEVEVKR